MPVADDERQHEPDQEEVEEIEHVADRRRERDLPLIRSQLLLPIEKFEHGSASLFACGRSGTLFWLPKAYRKRQAPAT
jgi:hypothetical protein